MANSKGYSTEIVTGVTLGDDNVTATATDVSGNTSMFTCYPIPVPSLIWPLSGRTITMKDLMAAQNHPSLE